MKYTPLDIQRREFEKAFRGLEEAEVRTFLHEVAGEWEEVLAENQKLKEEVLDSLSQAPPKVLSTGGGAVLREANRRHLRERGRVVYLKSNPEELFRRLRHDSNRPLLQVADPLQKLKNLFAERDPLYREVAHFVLETGRPSVSTLVNMIMMQLELGVELGKS